MPAWSTLSTGLKTMVAFKSDNPAQGLPTITANYLLIENRTGATVAMMGRHTEAHRRGERAGAADYLARKDASTMPTARHRCSRAHFVRAHAATRPIKTVLLTIARPTRQRAQGGPRQRRLRRWVLLPSSNRPWVLRHHIVRHHIDRAILRGKWSSLAPMSTSSAPSSRRCVRTTARVIARARVYVDTREGAEAEAGDLLRPHTRASSAWRVLLFFRAAAARPPAGGAARRSRCLNLCMRSKTSPPRRWSIPGVKAGSLAAPLPGRSDRRTETRLRSHDPRDREAVKMAEKLAR